MDETGSTRRSAVPRTASLALGLLFTGTGLVPPAGAHSIQVTPAAALDGSLFGLELSLDEPAPGPGEPRRAYVAIGPEKGVRNETALAVGFGLDPSGLAGARPPRSGRLSFLRLGRGRAGIVVFLERDWLDGWSIGAWSWDDAAGGYVLAGRAPLRLESAGGVGSSPAGLRLEVEWAAASEAAGRVQGHLRILSVATGGDRSVLVENTELNNASQQVGYVELGVRTAGDVRGVSGRLLIDDFQVNRTSPPLP